MQKQFSHTPDPCDLLSKYRGLIKVDEDFAPPTPSNADEKEVLQRAIHAAFDREAQRELDLHLPTFLKYIAKDVSSLIQLLHLSTQACSPISLTESVLELIDLAYVAANKCAYLDYDLPRPTEVLSLSETDYLLVYDQHVDLNCDATVCLSTERFALPPGDYRSFRLNALAGPRVKRDCALIRERLTDDPWSVVTRGYFLSPRFILHCRRPYIDSDMSIRQRLHLREAYMDTLALAFAVGAKSVSLPLITVRGSASTENKAYRTAIEAIASARAMGWMFRTVHLTGVPNAPSSNTGTLVTTCFPGGFPALGEGVRLFSQGG
jgi:hypothetical protein